MNISYRDEIHKLQLDILQDYFEIKMSEWKGQEWLDYVINYCVQKYESKGKSWQTYEFIRNEAANRRTRLMITKKSFDISLLNALLVYDFANKCAAEPEDINGFKDSVRPITDSKNTLISHYSDFDNVIKLRRLEWQSFSHLDSFINYLDKLGWGEQKEEYKLFLEKYKEEIAIVLRKMLGTTVEDETIKSRHLYSTDIEQLFNVINNNKKVEEDCTNTLNNLNDERDNEKVKRVNIAIAVKDKFGSFVPGYSLKMFNSNDEAVLTWITSNAAFCLLTDIGTYRIEEMDVPKGYKKGRTFKFTVKAADDDKTFVKEVEQSISYDELYAEAFDYLAEPRTYEQGMSLLYRLEKGNYLEAQLLLAFLLKNGLCSESDNKKADELIMLAGFQKSEEMWLDCADENISEAKYKFAFPYYVAYSQKTGKSNGYYQAGRLLISYVKNYEFCKTCFKLAIESGMVDAKAIKAYDYICKLGKEQYLKL